MRSPHPPEESQLKRHQRYRDAILRSMLRRPVAQPCGMTLGFIAKMERSGLIARGQTFLLHDLKDIKMQAYVLTDTGRAIAMGLA